MGRFLEKWAREHGLGYRAVGDHDVFELAWGEGAPRLGLVFHGDVVPAPAHEWKKPPFEPYVEKGRLYGRGVEDDKGPLVTTLLDIYRRHRDAPDAKPQSVRGGTYARLFPRAVDFGPAFPGDLYTGHAPDESISLDNLDATTRMVAEALHTLALDGR